MSILQILKGDYYISYFWTDLNNIYDIIKMRFYDKTLMREMRVDYMFDTFQLNVAHDSIKKRISYFVRT